MSAARARTASLATDQTTTYNPVAAGPGTSFIVADAANPGHNKLGGFTRLLLRTAAVRYVVRSTPVRDLHGIGFDLGNYYGNDAASTYNAFEVKVDKRFSNGLQFLTHYTYAHANNYTDQYYAISHEVAWGPVDFNRNQVWVFNTVYELPFGKGKKYCGGASRAMDYLSAGGRSATPPTGAAACRGRRASASAELSSTASVPAVRTRGPVRLHTWRRPAGSGRITRRTYFTPVPQSSIPTTSRWDRCLRLAGTASGPFSFRHCGASAILDATRTTDRAGSTPTCRSRRRSRLPSASGRSSSLDFFNMFNHPVYAFSANNGANGCVDCQKAG